MNAQQNKSEKGMKFIELIQSLAESADENEQFSLPLLSELDSEDLTEICDNLVSDLNETDRRYQYLISLQDDLSRQNPAEMTWIQTHIDQCVNEHKVLTERYEFLCQHLEVVVKKESTEEKPTPKTLALSIVTSIPNGMTEEEFKNEVNRFVTKKLNKLHGINWYWHQSRVNPLQ